MQVNQENDRGTFSLYGTTQFKTLSEKSYIGFEEQFLKFSSISL